MNDSATIIISSLINSQSHHVLSIQTASNSNIKNNGNSNPSFSMQSSHNNNNNNTNICQEDSPLLSFCSVTNTLLNQ